MSDYNHYIPGVMKYCVFCLYVFQLIICAAEGAGTWEAWGQWSQCIDSSSYGYKQRHRKCLLSNGTDSHVTCVGSSSETTLCYIEAHSTCAVCNGPADTCLNDYHVANCVFPNQYCFNHVTNLATGEKIVNRTCGDTDTCYEQWIHKSSKDPKCVNFDPKVTYSTNFSCSYCCVGANCNRPLKPDWLTWFRGTAVSIG